MIRQLKGIDMGIAARLAFAVIGIALFATACNGGGGGDDAAVIEIELFEYRPETVEVAVGDEVEWQNGDKIIHWVTAGTPEDPTGEFEEPMPDEGDTLTLTFDEVGEFRYFCTRHEFMRGQVVVTE